MWIFSEIFMEQRSRGRLPFAAKDGTIDLIKAGAAKPSAPTGRESGESRGEASAEERIRYGTKDTAHGLRARSDGDACGL